MDYKVVVTSDAERDLDQFIQYLLFERRISIPPLQVRRALSGG